MAEFKLSVGKTINLGNYESLKIELSVSEIVPYHKRRSEWVEETHKELYGHLKNAIAREMKALGR